MTDRLSFPFDKHRTVRNIFHRLLDAGASDVLLVGGSVRHSQRDVDRSRSVDGNALIDREYICVEPVQEDQHARKDARAVAQKQVEVDYPAVKSSS